MQMAITFLAVVGGMIFSLAVAVLAGTVTAGFLVLPRASRQWWLTGYFLSAGRTGGVASLANQSLRGLLTRVAGSAPGVPAGALAAAIVVGVIGLLGAAAFCRSGRPVHGWVLCALTGLLVSPISWDHHWVWMVPAMILLADTALRTGRARRRALWIATSALAAVFLDWLWVKPGNGVTPWEALSLVHKPLEYPWRSTELILGNAYVLAGLVLFAAMIAGCAELIAPRVGSGAQGS